MKQQWQDYSDKFLQLTSREQFLLLLTGIVLIFFVISYTLIDDKSSKIASYNKQSKTMITGNKTVAFSIKEYEKALARDPDKDTLKQVAQIEAKLAKIDSQLVNLTTELISPVQMREALVKLLELEPGVSLLSFELIGAQPLLDLNKDKSESTVTEAYPTSEQLGLNLYKHGIKIKLSGEYFQLRNYLRQLEHLSWKFFWQNFTFEVIEYPRSEVEITIYSLGLEKEFIGV
jgi:MSHA biogenesis protein MshJ